MGWCESSIELRPPELEHGFRLASLNRDRSLALVPVAISILTETVLGIAIALTGSAIPLIHLVQYSRFVIIPAWALFGWLIHRQTTPAGLYRIVSLWVLLFVAYTLLSDAFYPAEYYTTFLWDMIIILVIYAVMPMPLQLQLAGALLLSVGSNLSMHLVRGAGPGTYLSWSVLAAYAVANVMGFAISEASKRRRRHEYVLLVNEREARRNLERALEEIRTLQGMLPICSYCKRIRNDKGYWDQVDKYLSEHTRAVVSHALCPACLARQYPLIYERLKKEGKVE